MTRRAKLISVVLIAAVATALSGCATGGSDTPNFTSGMGTPSPTDSATASGSPTPTTGTSTGTSSPKPPTYPTNAKDYAIATATAWASGGARSNPDRLAQLATSGALAQVETWKGIDGHWGYINCDGTAGSSHCLFRNYNGDELTITVVSQYLGQPHASTEMLVDKTLYPNDAVAYATNLFFAWQTANKERIAVYSNSTVASKLASNPSFSHATFGGGGSTGMVYVTIEGAGVDSGMALKVKVDTAKLTKKYAVVCVVFNDSSGTC